MNHEIYKVVRAQDSSSLWQRISLMKMENVKFIFYIDKQDG